MKLKDVLISKSMDALSQPAPVMNRVELKKFVDGFLKRRKEFLAAFEKSGSPLYLIDEKALIARAKKFKQAFEDALSNVSVFYAIKSNSHPHILKVLTEQGLGLDVSSGVELEMALPLKCPIIFSGPGKSEAELLLAMKHRDRVTILLDSFGELKKLQNLCARQNIEVDVGVRLTGHEYGMWRKFGIPLDQLKDFIQEASQCKNVHLKGLQCHISWNMNADKQRAFFVRLGEALKGLTKDECHQIKFFDIGGGYWPHEGEWLQTVATSQGQIQLAVDPTSIDYQQHYCLPALSIEAFAKDISKALHENIFPFISPTIYLEPGRWICHPAMHILLQVADKKADDLVITDGGTNAVGWDRYETDYFPVINLSQPSLDERPCMIAGSLCTPHDLWGYNYFGKSINAGDILLVPTQGAYTYSLRQNFIKPLPDSIVI